MRFASGFATGVIALICVEIAAWGMVVAAPYRDVYREFQSQLPAITRIALSPGWIFGVVAALALATAGLNMSSRVPERARVIALAALAVVAVALAIGTAFAGVWPFAQLAGNISAE